LTVQEPIQALINATANTDAMGARVAQVMNGKDYTSLAAARAELAALQATQGQADSVRTALYQDQKMHADDAASHGGAGDIEFVNGEHMIVDRNGHPMRVVDVQTSKGGAVYRKSDGTLTPDLHGGPVPAGVVLVNLAGVQVDAKGQPLHAGPEAPSH